jgi:hypothetical protein
MENITGLEVPPPGAGVTMLTATDAGEARSAVLMDARS